MGMGWSRSISSMDLVSVVPYGPSSRSNIGSMKKSMAIFERKVCEISTIRAKKLFCNSP